MLTGEINQSAENGTVGVIFYHSSLNILLVDYSLLMLTKGETTISLPKGTCSVKLEFQAGGSAHDRPDRQPGA